MREVMFGPVKCTVGAENLVLAHAQAPERSLFLPIQYIPDLIRFLASLDFRAHLRAFRVPVDADAGLEVSVSDATAAHGAVADNISLVGISANLIDVADDIPEPGADVTVNLKLGHNLATLKGIVRRRLPSGIGIEFPQCVRDGCLEPPDDLRQIVARLESHWIRQRARLVPDSEG